MNLIAIDLELLHNILSLLLVFAKASNEVVGGHHLLLAGILIVAY